MAEHAIKHFTDSILYSIEQIARYIEINSKEFFSKFITELTLEEFRTIDIIMCNPDICQRDLAKLMLKDRATTGRLVESLEKKGLVSRSVDTKNNRLVRKLSVTKDGLNIVQDITVKIKKHLEETSKIIAESEIEKLKEGIKAFRASLEKLIELKI